MVRRIFVRHPVSQPLQMCNKIPVHLKRTLIVILLFGLMKLFVVFRTFYPQDKRSLLCSFGEGRLGNQLSAFATIYSYAQLYGYQHVLLSSQAKLLNYYFEPEESPTLEVLETSDLCQNLFGQATPCQGNWITPWPHIFFRNDDFYDYSDIDNPKYFYGHALNIGDYPNQIKSFSKFLQSLKNIFTFKPRFRENAEKKLAEARKIREAKESRKVSAFVGVHIRRTDYLNHLRAVYSVEPVELEYFLRAMDYFQEKLGNTALFMIVSDDLDWAREHINRDDVAFAGNFQVLPKDLSHPFSYSDDIGEDLSLLSACNHTIMSFGTFGLWGALLAGGQVVLPKQIMDVKEGLELKAAGMIGNNSGWHLL